MLQTKTNKVKSNYMAVISNERLSRFGKGIPWALISFAIGIFIYFSLPLEGSGKVTALLLLFIVTIFILTKENPVARNIFTILILMCIGYGVALIRTHSIAAPLLPAKSANYDVKISIDQITPITGNRIRYVGEVEYISGLLPSKTPKRIRINTVDQGVRFKYGDTVCARAILKAPGGPVRPDGYDFGRVLWFQQIGGTGYTVSRPRICDTYQLAENKNSHIASYIALTREAISNRINQYLFEPERAIAHALIIGNRGKITRDDFLALRKAGLGHLLAISGLHMAMFAGTLFFLARAFLALFPALALNQPIKKWAAIAAFIGGTAYFLISGQSIPTQRAYIMITIILLAILVNRPAITMRNVTLAATLILIIRPESLLSPGFQMSFAAVTALIAAYQFNLKMKPLEKWKANIWAKPFYYIVGIWLSSIIAGLATAPFALYHFHEISYMGPVGNMLAIPIFSFLIMPLAVISLTVMPFGLEWIFMKLMGYSIELLLASAHWTASFDPAMWRIGEITPTSLFFFLIAGIILCFKERPSLLLSMIIISIAVWQMRPMIKPDIYINKSGELFAVRGGDSLLHSPTGRKANFALSNWLKADGDKRTAQDSRKTGVVLCDDVGCSAKTKDIKITRLDNIAGLNKECQSADILITHRPIKQACKNPKIILNKHDFNLYGAYAIYINKNNFRIKRSNEQRNRRIWSARKKSKIKKSL